MSSLSTIMNIGVSGLKTAQDQLALVSDNISNVNTPGYIRKTSDQKTLVSSGVGMGVQSGQVQLAADKYLDAAAFKATSASAQADTSYDLLDQIQAQFGDITDSNNLFNEASTALTGMATAAEDPTSSATRQQVVSNLQTFLDEGSRISDKIQQIRADADSRIGADVSSVNDLLKNISALNHTISAASVAGGDASGAQTAQTQYISQLSKLIDVKVSQNTNGGVTVRTQSGMMLTGDSYVTLNYQPTSTVNATTTFNNITVTGVNGEVRDLADNLSSGELKGLIDVRDVSSVAVNDQLNQYMTQFATQLNAAHNDSSATPAPTSLTGKNTSLTQSEALTGMTGSTNLVTLDTSGNITHTMAIAFNSNGDGGGTYALDGGTPGTFTAANFASTISGNSGGAITAGFSNGVMTLGAAASNTGIAVVDPASGGSAKQGQGFSQYFGLNDLITSSVPTSAQTGLSATSNSGFTSGTVNFALRSSTGANLATVPVAMAGGSMTAMVSALNDTTTGLGRYGTFSLDGQGTLTFAGFGNPANTMSIVSDNTARNGTGASFSQFFGLAGAASTVATHLSVNSTISNDPSKLALGQVNMSVTGGVGALLSGDGSGGLAMAAIGTAATTFAKAGYNNGGVSTLDRYGSDLAGQVGNLSANAKTSQESAMALLNEANSRRSSAEGVNLDEELVNLTTYQQAYSASGRLIQAAKDMFDTLLNMV